jgi:hypothetical protein
MVPFHSHFVRIVTLLLFLNGLASSFCWTTSSTNVLASHQDKTFSRLLETKLRLTFQEEIDSDIRPCGPSREKFLKNCAIAFVGILGVPNESQALASYSANARNMERLNSGDSSAGSIYDNNPSSDKGKKRRAMTGCKVPTAREEAAESVLKIASLSEKDCNLRVMEGDPEFMLEALRKLDCSACSYGINDSR